jgi:mevalonate kinase
MENKLYKIVKSYPFSPPVGTILHYDSFADWYQNANEDYVVESRIIEKHPEYFEEVKNECRFFVYTHKYSHLGSWIVNESKKSIDMNLVEVDKDFIKFFKTKEDALEFIIDNKPCLSLDDLLSINHGNNDVLCITYDKLKRLVQERL